MGIDWGSQVVNFVNQLIAAQGGVLVPIGLMLLAFIGLGKLLLMVTHMLLRRLDLFHGNWHVSVHFSDVLILLFQIALCAAALNHWWAPGGGFSLHQLPSMFAQNIVSTFDRATIDNFVGYINLTVKNTAQPNPWQLLDVLVYMWILIQMGLLSAFMFVISSFGYIGIGLMTVLGPIFIPLVLTRRFAQWFWNWLGALFAFAMYRVMAAAIGWVWANVFIYFFVHGVGSDYSIANWLVLVPVVLMLGIGFAFSMFCIPKLCSMLFSGAGSDFGYGSMVFGAVRSALAAL